MTDQPEEPPEDEPVGYGKPPKEQRFKASGNPKGRPRGSKNLKTIVKEVAAETHKLTIDGKSGRYSTLELVLI